MLHPTEVLSVIIWREPYLLGHPHPVEPAEGDDQPLPPDGGLVKVVSSNAGKCSRRELNQSTVVLLP